MLDIRRERAWAPGVLSCFPENTLVRPLRVTCPCAPPPRSGPVLPSCPAWPHCGYADAVSLLTEPSGRGPARRLAFGGRGRAVPRWGRTRRGLREQVPAFAPRYTGLPPECALSYCAAVTVPGDSLWASLPLMGSARVQGCCCTPLLRGAAGNTSHPKSS